MTRLDFLARSMVPFPFAICSEKPARRRSIEIWHGDDQRVGHLGDAQDDFNVLGHVDPWPELDRLTWSLNSDEEFPLSFRAWRRLAADGDFNADVPVARMRMGSNTVTIRAYFRDGVQLARPVRIRRETGSCRLPCKIAWQRVRNPQDVGQYVDGKWELCGLGLRTAAAGYDRLFLIGERSWKNYEVRASFIVHGVDAATSPVSGGPGVGVVLRFSGHVTGGPLAFPSGQPKWGYQPFGAIGWLRWKRRDPSAAPQLEFYPGDSDTPTRFGAFELGSDTRYLIRARCLSRSRQDMSDNRTLYSFKIWAAGREEPLPWSWQKELASRVALTQGGVALVAHHVDASFGDLEIEEVG